MHLEYLLAPSQFFEPIERYEPAQAWRKLVQELLGPSWEVRRQGLWLSCRDPQRAIADQGFKLHVSPDLPRAEEQLRLAVAVLERHRTAFKFVADLHLLEVTNSKSFSRVDSGKFITAYPDDPDAFKSIALELAGALRGFRGPHILTDRPVAGSSCVFYRYGAFVDLKTVAGHRVVQALRQPDGVLVEDPREPFFIQPDWIPDPFDEEPAANEDDGTDELLGGRFAITDALQFSNAGGVYVADDALDGGQAILKEARPHTGVRRTPHGTKTAQDSLRSEYEILQRLQALEATPRPLALFEEGGHLFLAQQKVSAPTWIEFFSRDEVTLIPFRRDAADPAAFLRAFIPAMMSAIQGLLRIHGEGVLLGDVSPNNLLVDERTHQVTFIDLEAASFAESDSVRHLVTPGFVRQGRGAGSRLEARDDWYALAKCGLAAILPLQSLPEVASVSDEQVIRLLAYETGLPTAACDLLLALLHGDPMGALQHAARCNPAHGCRDQLASPPALPRPATDDRELIASRTAAFIAAQFRDAGYPAFWPVVPDGLSGNRWNIAHGAAGIAAFLGRRGLDLPAPLERALAAPDAFERIDDAGLYTGLSGVAYWLALRGEHARSVALLDRARRSPLRLRDPSVFAGDAGIGMAALSIQRLTGSANAAGLAAECAETLIRMASINGREVGWVTLGRPDRIYWGFSYGSAGIAFFLAEFGLSTGHPAALDLAIKALRFLLENIRRSSRGLAVIGEHRDDNSRAMYWANGSSGIASVLLRVGLQTDDRALLAAAHQLADASLCKHGVQCGQFDGMSGIAECMLDFASLTGDAKYLEYFEEMVSGLQVHAKAIDEDKVAFAGAGNLRLACDFATGAAGVGALLSRQCGEPRSYFDFTLPSATLFPLQPASDASAGSNQMHRLSMWSNQ